MKKETAASILAGLRVRGERVTPVRQAMLAIFEQSQAPLSAQDILKLLKKDGVEATVATIYRQLALFVPHGVVREIRLEDRTLRYELVRQYDHHHHLVCLNCNAVEDVELGDDSQRQAAQIKHKTGFTVLRHSLEFFGLCRKCRKPTVAKNN